VICESFSKEFHGVFKLSHNDDIQITGN